MSIRTWLIPRTDVPSSPSSSGSGFSFVPAGRSLSAIGVSTLSIQGGQDRLIDPVTKDYVRTDTGDWAETADSRTIMLIAMSVRLGESLFDPEHGSQIEQLMEKGLYISPEVLQSDAVRIGAQLQAESILSGLTVQVRNAEGDPIFDANGVAKVVMNWTDLASGSPINASFTPR